MQVIQFGIKTVIIKTERAIWQVKSSLIQIRISDPASYDDGADGCDEDYFDDDDDDER